MDLICTMTFPRLLRRLILPLVVWALCAPPVQGQSAAEENKVKAAFLYNFMKFVEWPARAFPEPKSPLVIGVVGKGPMFELLEEIARNQTVQGRPIIVKTFTSLDGIQSSHVLYIPGAGKRRWRDALERLQSHPVLTVGEEDFARNGGSISFIKVENKIRFEINVDAARRADLKIQSGLLSLARIVRDAPR
jgi:hypothetical protein